LGAKSQVVWFQDIGREHVALAGGKGANLGELMRAGIPVPSGFVVTTNAYVSYLDDANLSDKLASLLGGLDVGDREALHRTAAAARTMIVGSSEAPACAASVNAAYERLGGGLVAVRSSATAEDSETASFAGQQSTFLNISGAEGVMAAVRACWASLFEPQALHYRARCGIDHLSCSIAVPVQRMVQSARSGVAFTVDPVTHSHETIVIEAVRGLGEALVSGQVTPDMYVVDKASLAVRERTVVEQPRELVHACGAASGLHTNEWRDVSAVRRTRPKLNDDEIARLAAIVRRVEQHYGSPQDIEWAEEGGEFYIVQSRPITTLAQAHG
jgi:pyruvate, water dikinase